MDGSAVRVGGGTFHARITTRGQGGFLSAEELMSLLARPHFTMVSILAEDKGQRVVVGEVGEGNDYGMIGE
jgi:hypothetical protein